MQRTGIPWATHTFNPATGCLNWKLGICKIPCYAKKLAENKFYRRAFPYGFEPHFYPERLNEPGKLKKPAIIFAGSMSDLFGSWWDDEVIFQVLKSVIDAHWHKFVILTKNPVRMEAMLSEHYTSVGMQHIYFGTSVTGENCAGEKLRLLSLKDIAKDGYKTVISVEPLLFDPAELVKSVHGISWADWVIIGGQTKPKKFPNPGWKCFIRDECDPNDVPLFIKESAVSSTCRRTPTDRNRFPADLLQIAQAWGKQ